MTRVLSVSGGIARCRPASRLGIVHCFPLAGLWRGHGSLSNDQPVDDEKHHGADKRHHEASGFVRSL